MLGVIRRRLTNIGPNTDTSYIDIECYKIEEIEVHIDELSKICSLFVNRTSPIIFQGILINTASELDIRLEHAERQ